MFSLICAVVLIASAFADGYYSGDSYKYGNNGYNGYNFGNNGYGPQVFGGGAGLQGLGGHLGGFSHQFPYSSRRYGDDYLSYGLLGGGVRNFGGLRGNFGGLRGTFGGLRGNFGGLRGGLRGNFGGLRGNFGGLRGGLSLGRYSYGNLDDYSYGHGRNYGSYGHTKSVY